MTLAVYRSGTGQPLVMLHGWGMNSTIWGSVIDELNYRYEVFRVDLPGHGQSSAEAATDNLQDWVDAVMQSVPENAVWLGWSLGGMIALSAALRYPQCMRSLMLVTSTPSFIQRDHWPRGMRSYILESFGSELVKDTQRTLLRFLGLQVRGCADERVILKQLRETIHSSAMPVSDALTAGLTLLQQLDLREELQALRVPSLWLFGGKDTLVSAATSNLIENLLPQAKVMTIAQAGHAPFLSHPYESIAALEELTDRGDA